MADDSKSGDKPDAPSTSALGTDTGVGDLVSPKVESSTPAKKTTAPRKTAASSPRRGRGPERELRAGGYVIRNGKWVIERKETKP